MSGLVSLSPFYLKHVGGGFHPFSIPNWRFSADGGIANPMEGTFLYSFLVVAVDESVLSATRITMLYGSV